MIIIIIIIMMGKVKNKKEEKEKIFLKKNKIEIVDGHNEAFFKWLEELEKKGVEKKDLTLIHFDSRNKIKHNYF
jgi:hypothetical protein